MAKRNAKKNYISSLTREDGSLTNSLEQVGKELVNYYEQLFGTEHQSQPTDPAILANGQSLNREEWDGLTAEVTDEEVLSALKNGSMPFRYLGIPLTAERLKVAHFEELTRKIRTYIDGWSALTLSYAGRAELIRSVLQGVECYWISIFPLPDAVCTKIVKLCRNFLWGTSSKKVAWASICHPKSEGGLGFRDLRAWNNALREKRYGTFMPKRTHFGINGFKDAFISK
ncbi:hypothetical protein DH2020_003665 [Rehmannia glutinosa]|uniref:Uncharacterized protein n=1 Tax=Rehmannia glutinosa TaxID=99300 RepID=A0ABR0XME9_REHGL